RSQPYDKTENSSVVYAVIFTLMLPASLPYSMVITGVVVAILIGKHAFGGWGNYPFNPAAVGYAVVTVCWSDSLFRYPVPFAPLGIFSASGAALVEASAHTLKAGGIPNIAMWDLLLGSYAGPMGTTFCLVIAASAVFLLVRRRISLELPVSFLLTCMVVSLLMPRVAIANSLALMKYELLSGALLYSSVFLVCNTNTAPKNTYARILYGILCGFLCMMFRHYGAYELGVCFAVLLGNAFSGYFDRICSAASTTARKTMLDKK
ncbi:MAG: RnfABCDGE type electron transport complex subunit D, partial [Pygmaiobacter sp.]